MKSQEFMNEAKAEEFAWIRFEHASTTEIYNYLEEKGYDVIGANNNEILVGSMDKKTADEIQDIVYDFNDGAWVEIKFVSYEDIEHLL
jgi:hypothetical protein